MKRILFLGNQVVQLEHIIKTYEAYRLESGLWKSDVFVKDKQNVKAATRILSTSVQQCLATWNYERTISTQTYLKIGQNMLTAFTEPNISIRERARLAWSAVSFLRLWKVWINISGFKTETSFISDQTYRDFILAGHSIILSMKIYSIYFPESVYQPRMFGSNECEDLFAGLRGFCRGRSNLCMLDMIELSGRKQKPKELKIKKQGVQSPSIAPDWNNFENEIIEGMRMADKEVLKTIELLGMLPKLIQGNVIRKEGDNLVYLNRAAETWIDSEDFQPDETKVVEVEELLSLDNEVLFQSLDEQNENNHHNILSDLAATSSIVSDNNNEDKGTSHVDDDDDDDDDDDSPRNCALYGKGKCLYLTNGYRRPKETSWIGCEFPNCNDWYHESCLGLQLSAGEKDTYTFVCNKHSQAKGQFDSKVKASNADVDILLKSDYDAPKLLPKRRKTEKSSSKPVKDYSRLPSYVEFEGSFFHIAEFLSLQEGKVYRPQTSRISRWMASSQSDFYEQIDKLISPEKTPDGLYLDDFASFWVPNSGLNIGQIIRILWCPSYKSSYPVFEWKDSAQEKGSTSICIRCWTHVEVGLKWKLHPQNAIQWCDPKMLLEKYPAGGSDSEKCIDPSKLKLMLPRLEKIEEERLQKQRRAKEQERQEAKKGAPENLSKELLKEILTEHGITFKKSSTKIELINKVMD